ncbi:hypothetical protein [Nonomuraea harbinensis]|uniref:Uncharacterized protein n=1 Tax=Nonomuraea harbinensis TaxID=1286938 RepID=A0ABW1BQ39_9ACTN|nr:hypothetical protein [Nonomuraea harbinensis]
MGEAQHVVLAVAEDFQQDVVEQLGDGLGRSGMQGWPDLRWSASMHVATSWLLL